MIRRGRSRSVSVARSLAEDERLSFRAIGVATYLLSKPEGWRIDGRALARTHAEGRDAVYTALGELEAAGYLVRRRYQHPETGHWWTESVLYETPEAAAEEADDSPPESGFPGPGNPASGAPGLTPLSEREKTPQPPTNASDVGRAGDERKQEDPPPAPPAATPRGNGTNPRAAGTNPRGPKQPAPPEPRPVIPAPFMPDPVPRLSSDELVAQVRKLRGAITPAEESAAS